MALAMLSARFQSLLLLSTSKLGSSGSDSQVGGFLYVLGPCGSLQRALSYEARSFSCHLNSHRCFQCEVLRLYFPVLEPWVARSLISQLFFLVYLHANMELPGLPDATSHTPNLDLFLHAPQNSSGFYLLSSSKATSTF